LYCDTTSAIAIMMIIAIRNSSGVPVPDTPSILCARSRLPEGVNVLAAPSPRHGRSISLLRDEFHIISIKTHNRVLPRPSRFAPKKPLGERKSVLLGIRLTEAERGAVEMPSPEVLLSAARSRGK
jgi:hypothetical protein